MHEANLVAVLRAQLLQRALGPLAERALKIGELDDRHGRILGPERRMPALFDHDALRLEQNLYRLILAQAFEQRLAIQHFHELAA